MIHLSGNPFMQTQHRSQPMRLNSCGRRRSFRAAFLHSTHRKCRRGGWHQKDGAWKSLVAGPRQGRRLGRRRKRVCMVLLQSWPGHGSADLLRSVHQRSVQIFRCACTRQGPNARFRHTPSAHSPGAWTAWSRFKNRPTRAAVRGNSATMAAGAPAKPPNGGAHAIMAIRRDGGRIFYIYYVPERPRLARNDGVPEFIS